jgi:hypothetical protein
MTAFLHPADIGGRAYLAPAEVPASETPPAPDSTKPSFDGSLSYTKTSASITVDWSATTSTDNVGVARREYRLGGAGAYTAATSAEETSKSHTFAGLQASTPYQVEVRCVDTSGNASDPLIIGVTTNPASGGEGAPGTNFIRGTLATRAGVLHVNLATLSWSLFAQLLPANFGAPAAKGTYTMPAGSAEMKIAVPAATVPAGWYMLALSDPDGTTTVLSRVLVGP